MRCSKCHFVSFDYLAQCKKCGTDLRDERERLNLFDFEPAMPDFIGLLDRTELPPNAAEPATAGVEPPRPADSTHSPPALELILPDALEEPVAGAGAEGESGAGTAPVPPPQSLSAAPELVLDDQEPEIRLELSLDDPPKAPRSPSPPAPPAASGPFEESPIELVLDDEEVELELSAEEMERILAELNQAADGAPGPSPKPGKPSASGENS